MNRKRMTSALPKLLRVSQAARYLGVSRNFIQRLLDEQALSCVRLDGYKIRLIKGDLDEWVNRNRTCYQRAASRNKRLGRSNRRKEPSHGEQANG